MENSPDSRIPPEVLAEMEEAVTLVMAGVRDQEVMRKACEHMDRIREVIRAKQGILNIGVPAIRELRGDLPDA